MKRFFVAALAFAGGLGIADARAEPTSAYSSIDLDLCPVVERDDESSSVLMRCADFNGHRIEILEGDLRFYLIIDDPERAKLLSGQTLPPFNHLGQVIEWRLDEAGEPFAIIVRYLTDEDRGDGTFARGQVLVVSKIGDTACHVATVDARRHADANRLARAAADSLARDFRCGEDGVVAAGE